MQVHVEQFQYGHGEKCKIDDCRGKRLCPLIMIHLISQAEHIVPVGALSPNAIHLPSIYVDRIVPSTSPKQIEYTTLAPDPSTSSSDSSLSPGKVKAQAQRHHIAKRAAKEIKDGFHVNLGIGMPTLVPEHL